MEKSKCLRPKKLKSVVVAKVVDKYQEKPLCKFDGSHCMGLIAWPVEHPRFTPTAVTTWT